MSLMKNDRNIMYYVFRICKNKTQYVAYSMCRLGDKLCVIIFKSKSQWAFEKVEQPLRVIQLISGLFLVQLLTIYISYAFNFAKLSSHLLAVR